jgi:hypothetical protein
MPAPTNCTAGKSFLHKTNPIITEPLEGHWSGISSQLRFLGVLVGPASFRDKVFCF